MEPGRRSAALRGGPGESITYGVELVPGALILSGGDLETPLRFEALP